MAGVFSAIEPRVERLAKTVLPRPLLRGLARTLGRQYRIPVGRVRLGDLAGTEPVSRQFGFDRGLPVDRLYIERFLAGHAEDVRGRVLEVKDSAYARRFGGARVRAADVLDIDPGNPAATIVADLAGGEAIPSDAFDCIILTQTLHLIFNLELAANTLHGALRPGGVLLLTVPGITKVHGKLAHTWHWSFTGASLARLFTPLFPDAIVESHGNVLAATAFLHGLAVGEVPAERLEENDPEFPVIVTLRAVKERPAP